MLDTVGRKGILCLRTFEKALNLSQLASEGKMHECVDLCSRAQDLTMDLIFNN